MRSRRACRTRRAAGHRPCRPTPCNSGARSARLSAGGVSPIMTPTLGAPHDPRRPLCLLVALPVLAADPPKKPVAAVVESSLKTAGGQIRQFAFDGDPETYFASDGNARQGRPLHPRLRRAGGGQVGRRHDRPAQGRRRARRRRAGGVRRRQDVRGAGQVQPTARPAARRPARSRPSASGRGDLKHPLVIREITIESDPPVATFRYPVEFAIDVSDAPEMKEWAEKAARVCERQYPMINDELKSDGFKPRHAGVDDAQEDYSGVAAAGGGRITGSVEVLQGPPGRRRRDGPRDGPRASSATGRGTTPAGWSRASPTTSASSSTSRASSAGSTPSGPATTAATG